MDRLAHDQAVLRWIAVIGGVLAIVVSFPQLRWVYEDYIGMPTWAAYLVPLMIDLLAVMFAGVVGTTVGAPRRARLYSWAGLGVFVAVSVAGNAMHAWWHRSGEYLPTSLTTHEGWVLLMFAAMPPIGAALGIHGRSFLDRIGVDADRAATEHTRPAQPAQPARTTTAQPAQAAAQPTARALRATAEPERAPTAHPATTGTPKEQARALFDQYGPAHGLGARIHRELTDIGVQMPNPATVRRWVQDWTEDIETTEQASITTAAERLSA